MERDHLEDLSVDGWVILKCIFNKWDWGGMECCDLALDRGRWRALVDAVMFLQFQ